MPALVQHIGAFSTKTAGTAITWLWTGSSQAGNVIVCGLVFDNAATASKPVVSSISKPAGETANWVFLGAARSTSTSAGAFASGELWAIRTTVAWTTPTITATLDTSVTMRSMMFSEYSGVQAVLRNTVGTNYSTTTTAASATTTGTTPSVNDLAIGLLFGSNVATVQAGDTDTTGGSWSAVQGIGSTGGNVNTNNMGVSQYKVLTAASHQTYNNSAAMTAGNGAIVAILQFALNPKISTLTDTFATQIDPATWSTWGGTVWEGGRVKAQPAVATGGYGGVYTVGEYDFTESTIFARIVPPQEATGRETMIQLYKDDDNLIAAIISNWGLFLRIRQGAVNTDGGTITYHGAALAWIRLRMSGTTVYLDASADGTTWFLQQSATTSLDMTSCKVYLMSGQWQAESAIVPAYFDNINTTVAAPLLGTLSDSFATEVSPLLWRNNGGSVSWVAGQARVIGGNPGYTYLMSQLVYDLRESSIYAKIELDSVGYESSEAILRLSAPWDNHNVMIYTYWSGGSRYAKARSRENAVNNDSPAPVGPLPLTYWLRIGLSGTTVSYDWSVDGSSWTSIWTRTVTPANLAVVQVFFECGNWQAQAGWLTSYVDNVNVPGATGRPKAWMGTQYEKKPGKYWNGSAWVEKPWKEWDGSSWKTVK